ncbi:hypothetical protein [Cohnella mopanensis]|nr:hypothetical protein [Cohnella mopanensis]
MFPGYGARTSAGRFVDTVLAMERFNDIFGQSLKLAWNEVKWNS